MPSPARHARKRDADGDGAAVACLRCTMRRASGRAPLTRRQRRATAGTRPRTGGRWLTGFKDLWLTRPFTGPKRRETRAFPGLAAWLSGHRENDQLIGRLP